MRLWEGCPLKQPRINTNLGIQILEMNTGVAIMQAKLSLRWTAFHEKYKQQILSGHSGRPSDNVMAR